MNCKCIFAASLIALAAHCTGDTIVSVEGSGGTTTAQPLGPFPAVAPYTPVVLAYSWTQDSTFQNVTVSATLFDSDLNFTSGGIPYYGGYVNYTLVDAIGPGTSYAVNGIAHGSTFINDTPQSFPLFTLPSLGSGTYYLVLDSANQASALFQEGGTNTTTTAPGVMFDADYWSYGGNIDSNYTPGSSFNGLNFPFEFAVTGDPASAPEPASVALLGTALLGFGLIRWRKKAKHECRS